MKGHQLARGFEKRWIRDEYTEIKSAGNRKAWQTEIKMVDVGVELKQVKRFKYLGIEIATEGRAIEAVKQRIKMAWTKWREITGVVCDWKMPMKPKCKLYKTIVRPVPMYGVECWAVSKKVENFLSMTEIRML